MTVKGLVQQAANRLHSELARAPKSVAGAYLYLISITSRAMLPRSISRRVMNSICGIGLEWPAISFRSRKVIVASGTEIRLVPHMGEFDQAALFTRTLDYERPVFEWLENNASKRYDLIIEIGANVGVYTVFLDSLIKRDPMGRLKRIVSFEPSQEAYGRLVENLRANGTVSVDAFRAAVGTRSGLESFFEPRGHLTNGSFIREFSALFSDSVQESVVTVVSAQELGRYYLNDAKVLIKIDVEGFEPQLIEAMSAQISSYRPDLLIEVLPGTPERIEPIAALNGYKKYLVAKGGLKESATLYSSDSHRDWILMWPENAHAN
jgi:FkbM family methyltransferase